MLCDQWSYLTSGMLCRVQRTNTHFSSGFFLIFFWFFLPPVSLWPAPTSSLMCAVPCVYYCFLELHSSMCYGTNGFSLKNPTSWCGSHPDATLGLQMQRSQWSALSHASGHAFIFMRGRKVMNRFYICFFLSFFFFFFSFFFFSSAQIIWQPHASLRSSLLL